jgi:hypothetical protein
MPSKTNPPPGMETMPLLIDWSEEDPFDPKLWFARNHEDNWLLSASTRRKRVAARILATQSQERKDSR